ncbi:hypothetical protein ABIE41_002844 [Bosea sp. OAE506]
MRGDDLPAPALARPHLRDAGAAGGRAFLAVPVEAQQDAAELVDVDVALLAAVALAHDLGGVRAEHGRAPGDQGRAEAAVALLELVGAAIGRVGLGAGAIGLPDEAVAAADHQIFDVLRRGLMGRERHQRARMEARRIARRVAPVVLRLLRLGADPGEMLALVALDVAARVVIGLEGLRLVEAGLGLGRQVRSRLLEIVIPEHDLAGAQPAHRRPMRQVLDMARHPARRRHQRIGGAGPVKRRLGRGLDGVVRGAGIGQHQLVVAVAVLEVKIDAVLLHQPQHEVQVALAILHAVGDRLEPVAGAVLEACALLLGEDRLDDVDRRLLLEDAAVGALRQQPEPRPQGEAVVVQVLFLTGPLGVDQRAVEDARAAVLERHRHGALLTHDALQVGVFSRTAGVDLKSKEFAQAFRGFELHQGKNVLTQRCRKRSSSLQLSQIGGHQRNLAVLDAILLLT